MVWVTGAVDGDLRRRAMDLAEIVRRQVNRGRAEVSSIRCRDGRSEGRVARVATKRPPGPRRAPVTFASARSGAWANSRVESIRLRQGRVSAPAHVSVCGIGARQRSHDRTLPTRATVCC
jgi:hypothetical protein